MAVLFLWCAIVFIFWHSLRRLPSAEYLISGLQRVAALFFGRECTILCPGRVKDFTAPGTCLPIGTEERRDDVNLYLPRQPGVVLRAAFLFAVIDICDYFNDVLNSEGMFSLKKSSRGSPSGPTMNELTIFFSNFFMNAW